MMRLLPTVVCAFGLAATAFWGGKLLFSQISPRAPVASFTARILERNIPSPGATASTVRLTEHVYARRSNRSFAHAILGTAPDGTDGTLKEILDTVSNTVTVAEPTTKSKITYVYTAQRLQRLLNNMESENCSADSAIESAGNDEALTAKYGHRVKHIESNSVAGEKPRIVEESWRAPELECFAVKETATRGDGAQIIKEVTSLTDGPPQDDLFTIPADYTERAPSEVEHLYQVKFHKGFFGDSVAATMDKKYHLLRSIVG